jgi:glycosyltransferase involved in cell wall biosynthesis
MIPKVSVVVPSYNHGRYLAARLDSVLAQTLDDFELIFLDDASPDDSLAVFETYRHHPKVRATLNDRNSGCVFKQWNKGVRAARGRYVWIAESDDVADPKFLETLVGMLDANPTAGLAYCKSLSIDDDGKVIGNVNPWVRSLDPERWESDFVATGLDECRRYFCHRNTIPNASAVLIRKSVYEQVGYANEEMRLLGDWEMWVRILLASDLAYTAQPLNYYRHPHDRSVRITSMKHPEHLRNYMRVVALILEHGPLPAETWQMVLDAVAWHWMIQTVYAEGLDDQARHLEALELAGKYHPDFVTAIIAGVAARTARSVIDIRDLGRLVAQLHWALTHPDGPLSDLRSHHDHLHRYVVTDLRGRYDELQRFTADMSRFMGDLHRADQDAYAARVHLEGRLAAAEATIAELGRQVREQGAALRFWDRIRRLVLPPGGLRHRLLRKSLRLVRRKAA